MAKGWAQGRAVDLTKTRPQCLGRETWRTEQRDRLLLVSPPESGNSRHNWPVLSENKYTPPPRLSCGSRDMSTPLTWTFITFIVSTALWGGRPGSDLVLRIKNWEMRELSLLWHLSLFTSQGFELDRIEFKSWLGHEELEQAIHFPSPHPPYVEMGAYMPLLLWKLKAIICENLLIHSLANGENSISVTWIRPSPVFNFRSFL